MALLLTAVGPLLPLLTSIALTIGVAKDTPSDAGPRLKQGYLTAYKNII